MAFAVSPAAGLSSLLPRLHRGNYEGQIILRDGPLTHRILLRGGLIRGAFIEGEFDPLGRLLFREGKITRRCLQHSLERMTTTSRLQGQLLCEMGVMTHQELEDALRRQLLGRLLQLMALETRRLDLAALRSSDRNFTASTVHPHVVIREHIRRLSCGEVRALLVAWSAGGPIGLDRGALKALSLQPWERQLALGLRPPIALSDLDHRGDLVLRLALFLATVGALRHDRLGVRKGAEDPGLEQAARVLGVPLEADRERLKAAYRQRVLEAHPDRHPDADEETQRQLSARFTSIQRAYELLSGPKG